MCFNLICSGVLKLSVSKLLRQVGTLGGADAPTLSIGRWLHQLITSSSSMRGVQTWTQPSSCPRPPPTPTPPLWGQTHHIIESQQTEVIII